MIVHPYQRDDLQWGPILVQYLVAPSRSMNIRKEGFYNAVKLPDLKGDGGVNQQMMVWYVSILEIPSGELT